MRMVLRVSLASSQFASGVAYSIILLHATYLVLMLNVVLNICTDKEVKRQSDKEIECWRRADTPHSLESI